ncbi:MAG: protoheme IX farnesyltransferase [Actinobacteria bacterium]|jgi:protoheme IX farnesyltransferase|nr:protoheme IX farnesyltransferase [Actinomycetota bacterium]
MKSDEISPQQKAHELKKESFSQNLKNYVALTKPRIIELLLVTTVPTMFLASGGWPNWLLVLNTFIGGALAAGGANALNNVVDRDIDALMTRTAHRPLVTGKVSIRGAIALGVSLSLLSVIWLQSSVNTLSAVLAASAIVFYVCIYTLLLKRRTSSNIVWGGAAGCFPVLIGWAAVTNKIELAPIVLFLIVFWWTPPHYWPLSMQYKNDYANAGVPMLPVVSENIKVANQIIIYSFVMSFTTLILPLTVELSIYYWAGSIILNILFLKEAFALRNRIMSKLTEILPMKLFNYSITYLALLFLLIGIDPLIS